MDAYKNLAASYDRLTNDVDYEATVEFYMEILRREGLAPRTVVDLACGTGSVTEILARKGYRVTGVDMSRRSRAHTAMSTPLGSRSSCSSWQEYMGGCSISMVFMAASVSISSDISTPVTR